MEKVTAGIVLKEPGHYYYPSLESRLVHCPELLVQVQTSLDRDWSELQKLPSQVRGEPVQMGKPEPKERGRRTHRHHRSRRRERSEGRTIVARQARSEDLGDDPLRQIPLVPGGQYLPPPSDTRDTSQDSTYGVPKRNSSHLPQLTTMPVKVPLDSSCESHKSLGLNITAQRKLTPLKKTKRRDIVEEGENSTLSTTDRAPAESSSVPRKYSSTRRRRRREKIRVLLGPQRDSP